MARQHLPWFAMGRFARISFYQQEVPTSWYTDRWGRDGRTCRKVSASVFFPSVFFSFFSYEQLPSCVTVLLALDVFSVEKKLMLVQNDKKNKIDDGFLLIAIEKAFQV